MKHDDAPAEYGAARPDEYDQVLHLWSAVFGAEDRAYYRAFLEGDPWRKEAYCQVARVRGRIVSALYLCRRPMRYQGQIIYLGRIEAVATLPAYRRRGLSTHLLRRSVAMMEAEDFAFSALNTGHHSHYTRHDFYRVPLPKNVLSLDQSVAAPKADPDVRPLSLEEWIEEALPVYAAFNATLPVSFERSLSYWNGWLRMRWEGVSGDNRLLLGLRQKGGLTGYVLCELPGRSGERVEIAEAAALEPEGLARLLAGAVHAARSAGAAGLFGPHLSSVRAAMLAMGELKVGEGGVMHRRIHAPEAVMREIDHCYQSGSACWWNHSDGY